MKRNAPEVYDAMLWLSCAFLGTHQFDPRHHDVRVGGVSAGQEVIGEAAEQGPGDATDLPPSGLALGGHGGGGLCGRLGDTAKTWGVCGG